jgi:DNA-binding XRE family transcriptional regulator
MADGDLIPTLPAPGDLTPEACRELRDRLQLTTYRLAGLAGLAERTVVRFEEGLVAPRPGTRIALRRAFRAAHSLGAT